MQFRVGAKRYEWPAGARLALSVVVNVEEGAEASIVDGDKYADGQWVPLGARTMDVILNQGFSLKSWVVKNMAGNRAKRNLDNLWRYRALRGGFYIFKHEHVLVFRKE